MVFLGVFQALSMRQMYEGLVVAESWDSMPEGGHAIETQPRQQHISARA